MSKLIIDCKQVAEKPINGAGNITVDGFEVLGRMVRSRGPKDNSAPVSATSEIHGDCSAISPYT